MPCQETVTLHVACVAQPNAALLTPPHTIDTLVSDLASFTPPSLVPVWMIGVLHLHRKVSQWQCADGSSTATWPTSGAIVTDEQLRKLDAIVLDVGECRIAELLEKYVIATSNRK